MTVAPFISAISLSVLLFLAVLLAVERRRSAGMGYLLALLLFLGLFIGLRLSHDLRSPLLVYLPFVAFPCGFLYAPFIFLYSEKALFNRGRSRLFWLGLLAVPVLMLALHSFLHLCFIELRSAAAVAAQAGIIAPYSRVFIAAALLYNLGFLLLTARNLRFYSVSYEESFAGNDRDQLKWLKLLTALNLVLVVSFIGVIVIITFFDLKIPQTPFEGVIALIMIYVILYYFVKKPAVFTLPPGTQGTAKTRTSGSKYQKQNLSDKERKVYLEKIENHLREEKPFLDDKVTLASLARELGIPAHHFSMVINIERSTNFYHFINAYRVEEAKDLLTRDDMRDETVLDIALMAGFQSKAGFNKVFKEMTGSTPSDFRERGRVA